MLVLFPPFVRHYLPMGVKWNHKITLLSLCIRRGNLLLNKADTWGQILAWYKPGSTSCSTSDHDYTCHPVQCVAHRRTGWFKHWQRLSSFAWFFVRFTSERVTVCHVSAQRSSQTEFPCSKINDLVSLYLFRLIVFTVIVVVHSTKNKKQVEHRGV